jgi:hypothetical protein
MHGVAMVDSRGSAPSDGALLEGLLGQLRR